jgi:hypothetical protein
MAPILPEHRPSRLGNEGILLSSIVESFDRHLTELLIFGVATTQTGFEMLAGRSEAPLSTVLAI